MRYLVSLIVVLVAALFGVAALFWVQNASRTTQLSLDLGFAAWQLSEPVGVPALIAASFAAGLLLGGVLFAVPSARNGRKARRLEQELALTGATTDRDGWRG